MKDIQDDKELQFAVAMANPKFRGAVVRQVQQITWSSQMAKSVADFFCQPAMDGQPFVPKALYAHMAEEYIKEEIQTVLNECMDVTLAYRQDINDQYTNAMIDRFRRFYQNRVVTELFRESNYDIDTIVNRIGELKDMGSNTIPLWNMAELDVDTVIAEELGEYISIPSNFPFVYRATNKEGYASGQVCMVCAPPGVGKTLFLAHEVVAMMRHNRRLDLDYQLKPDDYDPEELEKQKIKVFWLAAGDMMRIDFIRRMTAIYLGESLSDVTAQTKKYFTDDVKNFLRYVDISAVPAAYVDAYGIKHFIETQLSKQDPNVIIVDYDSNVKTTKGDDMYKAGEELYNVATAIARPIGRPGRLVFVASQPKIGFWAADLIPMEAAAESSRKQAVIDMMITIGKSDMCPNDHAGQMQVAKMRRGKVGERDFYKLVDGVMHVIDSDQYNAMKEFDGKSRNNSGGFKKSNSGFKQYFPG